MNRLRTYVVEDSAIIRDNLTEALEENAPVQVIGSADDEAGAVAWLRDPSHDCDLVVIDIFLRAGNGLGVLKSVAQLERNARLVVLSNHATPAIRAKCAELGADRVFDKSNEIDEMLGYCNRLAGPVDHSMPSSL